MPGSYGPIRTPKRRFSPRKRTKVPRRVRRRVRRNTDAISKLMRTNFPLTRYQRTDIGTFDTKIHTNILTAPATWVPCFRSYQVPDEDQPRSFDCMRIQGKWTVQVEDNSEGNAWLQCFVVSLKPKMAAKTLERTTRLSNMTSGLDYTEAAMGSAAGVVQGHSFFFLNPAMYTTHYSSGVRRIGGTTMGGVESTNIADSTTMGTYNVKWERTYKNDVYNAAGFRGITTDDIEPKNQLYFVIMSNADKNTLFIANNTLITGRQATSQ